jgi:hypothetical protein
LTEAERAKKEKISTPDEDRRQAQRVKIERDPYSLNLRGLSDKADIIIVSEESSLVEKIPLG